MRITLIKKRVYNKLLKYYKDFPALTLQNKGYENINRNKFTEKEKKADKEIIDILKTSIVGFRRFQNFKLDKNNNIVLRFQYNYDYEKSVSAGFTGVGYILLNELLNGFNEKEKL